MKSLLPIYVYIIVALIATRIPYVGVYVRLVLTLIHEQAHVLVAKLTGGRAHKISLESDTSGEAITSSPYWLGKVLTSYAGYTLSSLTAVGLFYLIHLNKFELVTYFFLFIMSIGLLLWVRNLFGFAWSITFISLMSYLLWKDSMVILMHLSVFLSSIVLVESVFSTFVILRLSYKSPKDAGDTTNLQRFTLIPAVLWGIIFVSQSLYAFYYITINFII